MTSSTEHRGSSASSSSYSTPLGRNLASSDKLVRQKAIDGLAHFLSAGSSSSSSSTDLHSPSAFRPSTNWSETWSPPARLAPKELRKLALGLFMAFWMTDKPKVQQAVADALADLVLVTRPGRKAPVGVGEEEDRDRCALALLDAFWRTIAAEWNKIDVHRMDKYYLLLRRFIGSSFMLLLRSSPPFTPPLLAAYNDILISHPLAVESPKAPLSVIYHVFSIYLEELARALRKAEGGVAEGDTASLEVPITEILQPFIRAMVVAPTNTVHEKVVSEVFDPLLEACDQLEASGSTSRKRRRLGREGEEKEEATEDEEGGEHDSRNESLAIIVRLSRTAGATDEASAQDVKKAILKAIFDKAAEVDTSDTNRRRMYAYVRSKDGV